MPARADSPRTIKIGAFNYYPAIFKDTDGIIKGFYVDALKEIEQKENLRIEYVYGSWSEGLERLQTGDVDILTSVAFTEERSRSMDYGKAPLLTVWGVLYALNTSELDDILEVDHKTIGVMKNDQNARHFRELTSKFSLECEFVEYDNFDDVFEAIKCKAIDAGVTNVTFGAAKQTHYNLRSTGVIFNPFEIFFASKKGKNLDILNLFDTYLNTWKHQETSVFNRSRETWAHGTAGKIIIIPSWLNKAIALFVLSVVIAVAFIIILKIQVKRATDKIRVKEAALRLSENQYRDVVEHTRDLITRVDRNGNIAFVNHASTNLWGLSPDACIGKSAFQFIHPDDKKITEESFSTWLTDTADCYNCENRLVAADGTVRNVSWIISCLRDHTGAPAGFASIGRDITEAKRAEAERLKLEQQIQLNSKLESLGILAGGIAHDFNNLMGGLFGYIDLASTASQNEVVNGYLTKALGAIERARDLTHQLLTFAKGGAPVKKNQHLFPFIQETVQFALSGSNVACEYTVDSNLSLCNFDKNQIGQVIDNIVINASQAMSNGGKIEIFATNSTTTSTSHPLLAPGSYVKISLRDHGIGIPKEQLPRIFDPFFTTKSKGHGLGLATCYSIVKKHDGLIDVESTPGNGTTFHIYLPSSSAKVVDTPAPKVDIHVGCGEILVMDDEAMMRDILQNMLSSYGYTVVCKSNGNDAVNYYMSLNDNTNKIIAMFFDLTVPGGMGGLDAVNIIRSVNSSIPVFVASGYAEDPIMRDPGEFGFTASICKPFKRSELLPLLTTYLPKIAGTS